MEVIITGGQGFLGQELCRYLLRKGELTDSSGQVQPIQRITLLDTQPPPSTSIQDPKVSSVTGDVASMGPLPVGPLSVFHLAGVMSGAAEKDFDLGLRVNLDGTRSLLDACRARGAPAPKFIFTSSIAVFGETYGDGAVGDTDKVVPKNTYGMTKACGELLVNDYTRRGFVDGRTGRLPSVVVRPGKPNAATTSCYSGVIREPLHGVDVALPVARPGAFAPLQRPIWLWLKTWSPLLGPLGGNKDQNLRTAPALKF
ncbi:unnamed protein product [Effrenium voratum]|nr:unnamed protein product [Effrenium voratum]